jgi:hypothetical protein
MKNLPHLGVKHGEWYINKHYPHLKNEKTFKKKPIIPMIQHVQGDMICE